MLVKVPAAATGMPPETGASRKVWPAASAAARTSAEIGTWMVDVSIKSFLEAAEAERKPVVVSIKTVRT